MNLLKAMVTVAGLTSLSRVAGFIRDILTASILGAGPIADAFFVALKLPNLFRRVTAEGAFSVSFVPMYTELISKNLNDDAKRFVNNTYSLMLSGLTAFTVAILLFMPFIIYLIAPGFHSDPYRFYLAVELSRVTFPYLILISLSSLMGGILNAHNKFAPYAAAPIFFNLSLIFSLFFFTPILETPGHALAWGVAMAGIIQFLLLFYFINKNNLSITIIKPSYDKNTKHLFKLMLPGIIGAGVMHINLFADLIIASMLETGSISYLYYADRLNQLPLGIVGIAIGTALLPMLSKSISQNNEQEAKRLFTRALEISFFLSAPAAVGLFMVALPVVITLFEHGQFTRIDSLMTTLVLTAYSIGMPAYVSIKVLSSAFWANQDTSTPVKVSVICTLVNIAISVWLAFFMHLGVLGIAVGTSIAGWLQFSLLVFMIKKKNVVYLEKRFFSTLKKIIASTLLMAFFLYASKAAIQFSSLNYIELNLTQIQNIFIVSILVIGGAIIYGLGILLTGAISKQDFIRVFKRGTV